VGNVMSLCIENVGVLPIKPTWQQSVLNWILTCHLQVWLLCLDWKRFLKGMPFDYSNRNAYFYC
jgi:hypothetical protein